MIWLVLGAIATFLGGVVGGLIIINTAMEDETL